MKTNRRENDWAVVVFMDITKRGKEVESECAVPMNWLSENEKMLWWPTTVNVKNKIKELPNCETWDQFNVVKIKFRGSQLDCEDLLEGGFSTSNNSGTEEILPNTPTIDVSLPVPPGCGNHRIEKALISSDESPSSDHRVNNPLITSSKGYRARLPGRISSSSDHRVNNPLITSSKGYRDRSPGRISDDTDSDDHSRFSKTKARSKFSKQSFGITPYNSNNDSGSDTTGSRTLINTTPVSGIVGVPNNTTPVNNQFPMNDANFQKRVLRLLLRISEAVESGSSLQGGSEEEELVTIESVEQFNAFEESVKENQESYLKLVRKLKRIGGRDVGSNIRNIMERLFTYGVLAQYNMLGKKRGENNKAKLPFGKTKICEAIIAAVLPSHKDASEADVKSRISNVLKYAPDKQGGGGRTVTP